MKSKIRLLLVAAVLTVSALVSAPKPAAANWDCFFYCWIATPEVTCCQLETCEIVCWP
jgi:hypothetical protein